MCLYFPGHDHLGRVCHGRNAGKEFSLDTRSVTQVERRAVRVADTACL